MFAKIVTLATTALLAWSVVAGSSGAHGKKEVYRVKPHDTLWTIASSHYAGDVRDAVWKIERANHLDDPMIRSGQLLVLP